MQVHSQIRSVIQSISIGTVGQELHEIFFPDEAPIPKECALWDYKGAFAGDKLAYAELSKDILSFFNSYGGYIFLGVSEPKKDEIFIAAGFDRPTDFLKSIRASLESYSSSRIDVTVSDIVVAEKNITAILIPKRPTSHPPAFLTKNGPDKKPGKPLFFERSTYFRQYDSSLVATVASEWEFLYSDRDPNDLFAGEISLSHAPTISRIVSNNLPDRNLICSYLFGREEILASLWAWIADELEPVRMLAGYGGRGKTSIAYEFASRFFRNAPLPFVQVLWVSAKRYQFRAEKNEYMELPEYWYSNPRELLEKLCLGTAALTSEELESGDESEYTLQKRLRESLRLLPSLVIVDDIDSLKDVEQKRVFELVQQVSAGAISKFLLTTRANFAFSDSQCIEVKGLKGEAYISFVEDRLQKFGLSILKASEIKDLQTACAGSPLWTDSVLRLMKQGYGFKQAITEWEGKPGEDARAAALRKELEALSSSAKRILYAASVLKDCSRAELLEITKIGKTQFDTSISELQTLFLVDAPKIIENEPRFSVPESTAIAVREAAEDLVADHQRLLAAAKEFAKKAAAASGLSTQKRVGFVVSQTMALISTGQFDKAIETVEASLKSMPNNRDLWMLKGRCLREHQPKVAIDSFNNAFKFGQRKPLLFDMWYKLLMDDGQFAEALDVANLAIDGGLNYSVWLPLRARAYVHVGLIRHDDGSPSAAVDNFIKSSEDFCKAINLARGAEKQVAEYRNDLISVNDAAWAVASKVKGLEGDLLVYDVLKKAIDMGDFRTENADRLVDATANLINGIDFSSESPQARAGRTRISDAEIALHGAKRLLESESVLAFDKAIRRLKNLLP